MCLLCAVAVGRPTSCRQTVLVYLVSCYPKRRSDSRMRSWEIWPIFLDDFFFPIPIFFCGIWLCVIPMLGNRILQGLFLGWSLLSYESQDSRSRFGHELYVALVWKLRGVCAGVCVCVCARVCTHTLTLWQSKKISVYWDFRSSGKALLLIKWTIFIQQIFI